ncbi:hypothetical protein Tco_1071284 [Tanacetum coccineum]
MSTSRLVVTNEKVVSKLQEVEPSCAKHVKTHRQPLKDNETHRKNWNDMMERELGECYSFTKKKCFVCGSLSHLIKDCDYYEKKMAREAEVMRVVNTGNGVAKPVWKNANRINHSNKFVPRLVQLNTGRPKVNSVMPNINTGRTNINSVRPKVNAVSSNINTVRSRQPTSASYNWRNFGPNFHYNSGPTFNRTVNAKGPQGRPKPAKAWVTRINCRILKNSMGDLLPLEVAKATYLHKVLFTETESQDDPLDSLEQGLVTPSTTKVNASGEEQVEYISPNTLEAAKTLSKKVVSSLDFQEEVDAGAEQVNTAKGVSTGSTKLSTGSEKVSIVGDKKSTPSPDKGQRAGKAPMIIEKTPKKSKEQILQEEASLAEAIIIAEEEELNEQQKKRKAQVQFEAQHYTNEDWDLIRAKIKANAELTKSMLGSDLQGEDFAKKMVDLVNQRKKYFAEERARAKRNKPMTQSQLKTYMMNYLKNQGTWKLSQLKNLSFEEVKKEFDKLVKQVESFAPINFEATKASLKRFGEELQTKTSKRLKSDEAKDIESTKKSGKRRKQMARKGLHTDIDKDDSEGSDEVDEQEESVTGTKIPINPVPVAMKTPSIATYKIIKQGEKGVYQIVREDGTDIVYINFGAMLKNITRDDLTELYRIVMNRYGMDGPEDKLEKIFWKYLKDMFEEPLSTDPVWSLLSQQRIISWRYYDTCRVHCLNLESMDIYMLSERKYPLSAEVCQTMLKMKLLDGKMNEDCYKMLKMMEKQAGIRK